MACFSSLIISLSFVIGFIVLGIAAELYYLLCWKKRITNREIEEDHLTNYAKELPSLFCWKKPNSVEHRRAKKSSNLLPEPAENLHEQDLELQKGSYGEESIDTELMRLHNLSGPPRFLFTINEETREDLESDDGKSRSRKGSRTRSLSDVVFMETPILTPLASPSLKSPHNFESYNHHGFNPLFESFSEAELNRVRSSPPPKFKFLRDAEEKLLRRLMEDAEKKGFKNGGSVKDQGFNAAHNSIEEKEGSFIRIVVGKNNHSSASQVLPLASSPSKFKPLDGNKLI